MDSGLIAQIITVALAIAASVFGAKYYKIKKLLEDTLKAAEDDKFTEKEIEMIEDDIDSLRE